LLANIYMHRYLRAWRERGKGDAFCARIVNYADDFVILSRGHAKEGLAWTQWAMTRLGLTLNATKTRLCNARTEPFNFLGYTFGPARFRKDGRMYLAASPSKKAVERLRENIRGLLRANRATPWPDVRDRLNRKLRGWSQYFSYGTRAYTYRAVENFVRTAVQNFLQRRHQVPGRGTRHYPAEVVFGHLGVLRLRSAQLKRAARVDS